VCADLSGPEFGSDYQHDASQDVPGINLQLFPPTTAPGVAQIRGFVVNIGTLMGIR
jgi:hypothetical protein